MNLNPEQIDAIFASWDRPDSPGLMLGIVHDGRLVWQRGYGLANLDHDLPIGPQTRFFIASMSKQFVAACLHLLAMEGHLNLDDDCRTFIPELPDYGQPIRLRHLLYHTSGLREYTSLVEMAGGRPLHDPMTNGDVLQLLARQKGLNAPPGQEFAYSNSGYVLLAEVIERVSGQSLRDLVRERIFEPLGMQHSEFDDDASRVVKERAESYAPHPTDGFRRFVKCYDVYGDSGIWSTVEDLARWDENFYRPLVGGTEFVSRMLAPGRLENGEPLAYASALAHWPYRGLRSLIHGGLAMGFRTQMMRFADQRFTVICLMNVLTTSTLDLCQRVADLCLADDFSEPPARIDPMLALPPHMLSSLTGVYLDEATGMNVDVGVHDGRVWVDLFGSRAPLAPLRSPAMPGAWSEQRADFRVLGGPMLVDFCFDRSNATRPWRLTIFAEMHELPVMAQIFPAAPASSLLTDYAGQYISEELNTVYTVNASSDGLELHITDRPPVALRPGLLDTWRAQSDAYCFQRNAQGAVAGFLLQVPRARNVRFVRR